MENKNVTTTSSKQELILHAASSLEIIHFELHIKKLYMHAFQVKNYYLFP